MPAICVADSSLALDPAMTLGWYAGNARQETQALLTKVLKGIAARSEKELLLIGGSGGGFAVLYYGYALGARASVLTWNPQTDWLEYDATVARHYLAAAYPELTLPAHGSATFKALAGAFLRAHGAAHSVVPIAKAAVNVPRRLVYLQNASDWHVMRHARPFMDAFNLTDAGGGFHLTDQPQGMFWFGNWGAGHVAAPKELVEDLLQRMLDPAKQPADLMTDIKSGAMAVYVDPMAAPRDLRRGVFDTKVEVATTGKVLQAIVHIAPIPEGHHQLSYAFYVYSGEERIATRWYEPDNIFIHAELQEKPATRVVAFVRDGFGHQLSIQETRTITKADALSMPQLASYGRRIHLYGSCVSRDAFEFAKHDFVLAGYIARSSLASAFDNHMPPPDIAAETGNIASGFQRRMVHWDLSRHAATLLNETQSDAVLLDLIDERFSLLDVDGALVTLSVEFSRTGYKADPERIIASGSDDHLAAWRRGVHAFFSNVDARKVIVNRVRWATHDSDGEPLEKQEWIARNNATLAIMYEHLATIPGIRFIDYPDELLIAGRDHKWGVSPFHYIPAMYSHTVRALAGFLAESANET